MSPSLVDQLACWHWWIRLLEDRVVEIRVGPGARGLLGSYPSDGAGVATPWSDHIIMACGEECLGSSEYNYAILAM